MIGNEPSLSGEPTPGRDKGRSHTLAEYSLEELIARWEEFFSERGLESEIIGLADRYPEERSLKIRFEDLNRFDTDMSIHLLRQPLNVLTAGEEAIRRVVPPTEEPVEIHLRVLGVPRDSRIQIRDLRAKHLGRFIAVEGLVRKATEVRPMVVDALFQCLRCGTVIKEAQEGQAFLEPMECYEDQGGCKRSANATKFKLLGEASRYTDTQKIEVQEAPEGLRGGEEPRRLSAFTEDDLTGKITPGMRVILNGVLRSSQKGRPGQKSTLFDIMLDVNSTEFEQVEFEEIEVTPEDVKKIEAEAADPDIYRRIVASIAPSLYGLTTEKEALALQLFSGVAKEMPDGRRIRGDIHVLLVGDPGTGKSELLSYMSRLSPRGIYATGKAASAAGLCIAGDSLVATHGGFRTIAHVVEHEFPGEVRSRPMETRRASGEIATFAENRRGVLKPLETVWRLKPPAALLEIETASGRKIQATPATKLLVDHAMAQSWIRAKFLRRGMRVATARKLEFPSANPPLTLDLLERVRTRISVAVEPELIKMIVDRLTERFGSIREAAARLLITEDALYYQWRNGRDRIPLATLLRLAAAAEIPKQRVAASIRDYSQAGGHAIWLPETLDADLSYFAGLIAGDGSVEDTPAGGFSIRFANSNPSLGATYDSLVDRLFRVQPSFTPQSPQRSASRRFYSSLVAAVLEKLGIPASPKSSEVTVPDILLNGPLEILAGFLRGLFDTDGTVCVRDGGSSGVSLTTTSQRLATRVQLALLRFGIHAGKRTRRVAGRRSVRSDGKTIVSRRDQFVVDIMDYASAKVFQDSIGFFHSDKARALASLPARHPHSNHDLVGAMGPHLREVRRLLDLSRSEAYGPHEAAGRDIEEGNTTTHATAEALIESLGQAYREDRWEGFRLAVSGATRDSIQSSLKSLNLGCKDISQALGISVDRAQEYFQRSRRPGGRIPVRVLERLSTFLEPRDSALAGKLRLDIRPVLHRIELVPSRLEFLRTLGAADLRWEPIEAIRVVPFDGHTSVYDLTVRDAHAFVANGILVHNTAAAVRDEFGEGRWTLEAGALVLADKGLACLHPSTEVLLDGVPTPIAALFDPESSEHAVAGGHPIEISRARLSVVGFDINRLSARNARTSLVSRRAYHGPIARVTLDSGLTLAITPDHVVLDGDTLAWRRLEDLRPGGRLVTAQRLPSKSRPVRLLDIVPDDWIVGLTASEKMELTEELVRLHGSASNATKRYHIRKDALKGRGALRVFQLRRILEDTGLIGSWRNRSVGFGRSKAMERLKVTQITPELAYVLGFIQGDGSVRVDSRRSSVSVFQAARNLRQIRQLLAATRSVTGRPWGMYERVTRSRIRGRPTQSRGYQMHRGSNLIAFLYEWITADGFANLLRLDDEALRGYVAGAMDSDGCISVRTSSKKGRTYQSTDVEFLLSSDRKCNERFILALRRFDVFARLREAKGVYRIQVTSRPDVDRLMDRIRPYSVKWKELPRPKHGVHGRHLQAPSEPVARLLQSLVVRPTRVLPRELWSTFYELRLQDRVPFKGPLSRIVQALTPMIDAEERNRLAALASSDYALDRIAEVRVEEFDGYVYDLRIPDGENFLANGSVVHNCIDELEKMNPQDRSAIHEAMEQQRVSVAKAGITAVLQARCAVLAAANPKFGRFDETKFVSEQLDLPPTLLSRFDVIFSLIDHPESERDRNMAEHILRGHLVGEWRRRRAEGKEVADENVEYIEAYSPHFEPMFFRKYVAYAKRFSPVMTPESMETIKAKYLEIRKAGEPAGASVPITPRQLEAIIRLAEASARARLSQRVDPEDADRAVRITEYWMRRIAGEEGRFDIDIVQVGISQSQRDQIITLRDVIDQLSDQSPSRSADYEDIVRVAGERGIPQVKVDQWLKRWAQEGDVYTPGKNKYKLVERL